MLLTLKSTGTTEEKVLRHSVEGCAQTVLGRLARRVSHAMVSMREHRGIAGRTVHVCTLRLRVPGATDTLIESLRPDPYAAVTGAFRQARRELIRRRRSIHWRPQPQATPA